MHPPPQEPYVCPELAALPPGSIATWGANQNANDFAFWLEQAMDPSHANFLHHGIPGFKMEQAIPLEVRGPAVQGCIAICCKDRHIYCSGVY